VQRISYRGEVPHHFDALYAPVVQGALVVAARARRLQSGRLGYYVAYLVGLVVVVLACARLGILGEAP
jgi:hydrogenase-4 component B